MQNTLGSQGRSRAAFLNRRAKNSRRRPGETKTIARQRLIAKSSRKGIGGRPTLYSPELADQILTRITIGDTVKEAAERFKITPDTLWEWMRYPDPTSVTATSARVNRKDMRDIFGPTRITSSAKFG